MVMEACSSAHYWARTLQGWGHRVRLLPSQYGGAYVRRNKTDAADAAALIEASRCCELRPVHVKTVEQQHLLQPLRLREQYKRTRNARLHWLRGAFREFGVQVFYRSIGAGTESALFTKLSSPKLSLKSVQITELIFALRSPSANAFPVTRTLSIPAVRVHSSFGSTPRGRQIAESTSSTSQGA